MLLLIGCVEPNPGPAQDAHLLSARDRAALSLTKHFYRSPAMLGASGDRSLFFKLAFGLEWQKVFGDGNCLFGALYRSSLNYDLAPCNLGYDASMRYMRNMVVNFLKGYPRGSDPDIDLYLAAVGNLQQYCSNISLVGIQSSSSMTTANYGDSLCLEILSRLLSVEVEVASFNQSGMRVDTFPSSNYAGRSDPGFPAARFFLVLQSEHYDFCLPFPHDRSGDLVPDSVPGNMAPNQQPAFNLSEEHFPPLQQGKRHVPGGFLGVLSTPKTQKKRQPRKPKPLTESEEKLLNAPSVSLLSSGEKRKRNNAYRRSRKSLKFAGAHAEATDKVEAECVESVDIDDLSHAPSPAAEEIISPPQLAEEGKGWSSRQGFHAAEKKSKKNKPVTKSEEKLMALKCLVGLTSAQKRKRRNALNRYKRALQFELDKEADGSTASCVNTASRVNPTERSDEVDPPTVDLSSASPDDLDLPEPFDDCPSQENVEVLDSPANEESVKDSRIFDPTCPPSNPLGQKKRNRRIVTKKPLGKIVEEEPSEKDNLNSSSSCCEAPGCDNQNKWPFDVDGRSVGENQTKCLLDFLKATRIDALERTCAVCEEDKPISKISSFTVGECGEFLKMLERPQSSHPDQAFLDGFDMTQYFLSPHGVHADDATDGFLLDICDTCSSSLMPKSGKPSLPKFAIANGNCFGDIPPVFKDLTFAEQMLISPYRPLVYVMKLKDGGGNFAHRAIKGNVIVFPKSQNLLSFQLPHPLNSLPDHFQVCFVGDRSKIQRSDIKRFLGVRKKVVLEAIDHLRKVYPDVCLSQDHSEQLPEDDVPDVMYDNIRTVSEADILNVHDFDQAEHDGYANLDAFSTDPDGPSTPDDPNRTVVFHVERTVYEDDCGTSIRPSELAAQALTTLRKDFVASCRSSGDQALDQESEANRQRIMDAFDKDPPITGNNKVLRVSHRRTPINEFNNPSLWCYGWVSLFPNGTGMPAGVERAKNFSLEAWAKHAMNLHNSPFASHHSFPLYLSNMLKRHKVLQLASLKLKCSSFRSEAAELSKLNLADLVARVKTLQFEEQASDKEFRRANQMVSVFGGRIPFSRFARSENRREMYALCARYGPANLYVTINPNDYSSRQVLYYSGKTSRIDISLSEFPSFQDCKKYALENPASCAKFFHLFISAFNECMVLGKHAAKGGIFGRVSAYYGTVETQGRGTLHYHSLIWLKDIPSIQEMKELLKSGCFRDRFAKYLDLIICRTAPSIPEELQKVSPTEEYTPLSKDNFAVGTCEFNHYLYYLMSKCQKHKCTFTCRKGVAAQKKGANFCRFGYHEKSTEIPVTVVYPDGSIKFRRVEGSKINPTNWPTLFGIQSNNDIQFIECLGDKRGVIIYCTKYITKEDVKTHNALAMLGLAAGKVLGEGSSLVNEDQAKRIFQKIQFQMNTLSETPAPMAMQFLLGQPDHYKNSQFVKLFTGPFLNAFNSVPFPDGVSSDEVEDGQDEESDESVNVNFDPISGNLLAVNQLADYMHRNPHLWKYSVFELFAFYRKYQIRSKKYVYSSPFDESGEVKSREKVKADPSRYRMHDFFEFCDSHPEHKTHAFKKLPNDQEFLPVMYKLLPSRRKSPELHAKMALILFYPFHSLSDLRSDEESSWSEVWKSKLSANLISSYCLNIYKNILAFNEAEDQCEEDAKRREEGSGEELGEGDGGEDPPADEILDECDADVALNLDHDDLPAAQDVEDCEIVDVAKLSHDLRMPLEDRPELLGVRHLVEKSISSVRVASADGTVGESIGRPSLFQISNYSDSMGERWKNELKRQSKLAENSELSVPGEDDPLDRDMFDGVMSPLDEQDDQPLVFSNVDSFNDQIQQVIADLSLNERQASAVRLVGEHLAKAILSDGPDQEEELDQLLLFISGEGGTGKSRVISAIQELFSKFGKSSWLVTSGSTGKAGCLVNGGTIHSYVQSGFGSFSTRFTDIQVKKLQDFWQRKRYLIIDEISMIGAVFFNYISAAITVGKGMKTGEFPFGGLNVICCGDFYQYPPVKSGRALYHPPIDGHQAIKASIWENSNNTGSLIFQKFKTIVLTEQVRQVGDPAFHALLKNLRLGACTSDDYKVLCSRLLNDNLNDALARLNFFNVSDAKAPRIIVAENALRSYVNDYMVLKFAKYHNVPCFKIHAHDSMKKVRVSENIRSYIKTLPETNTGRIPGILSCAPGVPLSLTSNVDKSLQLYNGQEARFLGFVPGKEDRQLYQADAFRVYEVKVLPRYLILDVPATPFSLDEQPKGFVPLRPQTTTFPIPFMRSSHRKELAFTVSRRGFPVVAAFAITGYKSQGSTFESGIIDLVPSKQCPKYQLSPAAYVPVSRFRSLQNLFVLRSFDIGAIQAKVDPKLQEFMNKGSDT